jgi:hypothetical protein
LYQIDGRNVIYDWLSHEPVLERRVAFLEWLVELATTPSAQGRRVPGIPAPVYLAVVLRPPVVVRYLIAEQFHTVRVIGISPLP